MRGATGVVWGTAGLVQYFNPRAPCGARLQMVHLAPIATLISIHAPHAGRDAQVRSASATLQISIHAPHAGRDSRCRLSHSRPAHFNPRAPCGARQNKEYRYLSPVVFQSTRPMRGATYSARRSQRTSQISIHAPHAGRDRRQEPEVHHAEISIHAPHAGRDRRPAAATQSSTRFQSTRPMRGATLFNVNAEGVCIFQSTRPMRGATAKVYKITLHTFATKGNS